MQKMHPHFSDLFLDHMTLCYVFVSLIWNFGVSKFLVCTKVLLKLLDLEYGTWSINLIRFEISFITSKYSPIFLSVGSFSWLSDKEVYIPCFS